MPFEHRISYGSVSYYTLQILMLSAYRTGPPAIAVYSTGLQFFQPVTRVRIKATIM